MSDFQKLKFSDMAYQITTKVNPAETNLDYYVGLEHIDPESLHIRRWGIPTDVKGEKIIVSKGDVIFGKRRAYQRKVAIAEFDCICSAHSMVLRSKEDKILNEIFPFFLQSDQFMEKAVQISVGGLSPTINWKDLAEQEFLIPKKDEQCFISKILWAAEDVIVKNEVFVAEVEHYKQLMMREMLQKGIGHTEYQNIEKIGMVPKPWSVKRLKDVATLQRGYDLPVQDRESGNIPIYGSNGICGWHSKIGAQKPGVVTGRSGTIGTVYFCEEDYWPLNTTLFVKDFHGNDPKFIWYLLQNFDLERYSIATSIPTLDRNSIHPRLVKLPQPPEQKLIVDILTAIDDAITIARNTVESSKALKMKLINSLLSPTERDEN